jgi:hypothetical protein
MVTHIARLGKVIGQYSPEDLAKALTDGLIQGGDHWWRAGMKDWKSVSAESPLMPEPTKTAEPATPAEGDWRIRPKHKPSLYGDEPATEKQLALIKDAGLTDLAGLTKYDASRWLDLILGTDDGRKSLNERQFQAMQEKQAENEEAGLGCDGHRTPSGQYRKEIKYCLQAIEEKKEETRKEIEEDPDSKEDYLSALKDEEKDYGVEIDQQMTNRADYWIWVIECSKANEDDRYEMMSSNENWETYMYVEDALAEKLFLVASKVPSVLANKEVIKDLLAKLDAGSDDWDDTQPDLLLKELILLGHTPGRANITPGPWKDRG